ncbi:unnamed protein product [Caenorhabditis auriculariae]|uniref:Uncharacterized protein n=1 Tax=Caenorhabditis auriculariae TaxID=2777116 RepID=A0A8S1H927_9PELO|nr:unnamed protein product [Caenorhabditis auriculariae]
MSKSKVILTEYLFHLVVVNIILSEAAGMANKLLALDIYILDKAARYVTLLISVFFTVLSTAVANHDSQFIIIYRDSFAYTQGVNWALHIALFFVPVLTVMTSVYARFNFPTQNLKVIHFKLWVDMLTFGACFGLVGFFFQFVC